MAYSTSNPPQCIRQMIGGKFREWIYQSTDAASVVRVSGYITNAYKLGMQVGDTVKVVDTDASPITVQLMNVVSVNTTTGAADLSDGVAITATNSD
jgi:hypothetical protein